MRVRAGRVIVAAVTMVLGACGSASASPTAGGAAATATALSATSVNACSLITQALAQQTLGEPVAPAQKGAVTGVSGCLWNASASTAVGDTVIITVDDPVSFSDAEQTAGQPGVTIAKISGLGDDAFYFGVSPNQEVEARKGSLVVDVNVIKGGSALPNAEVTVAGAALANLP